MKKDPSEELLSFLDTYGTNLSHGAISEITHFVEYNECGLAYDLIVFYVQNGVLQLSDAGIAALQAIAQAMEIQYPRLSTD